MDYMLTIKKINVEYDLRGFGISGAEDYSILFDKQRF